MKIHCMTILFNHFFNNHPEQHKNYDKNTNYDKIARNVNFKLDKIKPYVKNYIRDFKIKNKLKIIKIILILKNSQNLYKK